MNTEIPSILNNVEQQLAEPKPRLKPQEILERKLPYIEVGDQWISTENWPEKKCCQGRGYFGILHSGGQATSFKMQPNGKCECGSGLKYKKCCRDKIERLAKGGGRILICSCVGKAELAENEYLENLRRDTKQLWQPGNEEQKLGSALSEQPSNPE